jgi:hypothetical protein
MTYHSSGSTCGCWGLKRTCTPWFSPLSKSPHSVDADANKVLEAFDQAVERRLESIDAMSLSITAFARDTRATFPNVTISDFEIRCANSIVLSDTPAIQYYPLVTDKTRTGWEAYQIRQLEPKLRRCFCIRNQFDQVTRY